MPINQLKGNKIFEEMNKLGEKRHPFLFIVDFPKENGIVIPLKNIPPDIQFKIGEETKSLSGKINLKKHPVSFDKYKLSFDKVQKELEHLENGVINLTFPTPVEFSISPQKLFEQSHAKYKILWKNQFLCFSPETFVKIAGGKIYSFPMKGTIDAGIDDAEEKILNDEKEYLEHKTVAEQMKKDLEMATGNPAVIEKFRYIDKIRTHQKTLLQVSSKIASNLPQDYHKNLGNLFESLLPASSICGVPKRESMTIIENCENYNRNYYTGVFGVFDGENLDSAVLIRFLEKTKTGWVFKSGGGITAKSVAEKEYEEMIDKVYVPVY